MLALLDLAAGQVDILQMWMFRLAGLPDKGSDWINRGNFFKRIKKLQADVQLLTKRGKKAEQHLLRQAKFSLPSLTASRLPVAGMMLAAANAISNAAVEASNHAINAATARQAEAAARVKTNHMNVIVESLQTSLITMKRRLQNSERQLQEEVRNCDLMNAELLDDLAAMESETISAKDDGKAYSIAMQECILRLQALKVSQGSIDIDGAEPEKNILARIVASLKNVMSDRAATQVKFNTLFELYRFDCLKLARDDWHDLSVTEREQLCQVNTFFCNLHLLANLGEKIIECMALLETAHFGKQVETESCSVISLLRDIAKYFASRSAAKWGVCPKWVTFLLIEQEVNVLPFPSFLGHRFNIMFLLAARIFQARKQLIKFCDLYASDNVVLKTIATRLRNPFICAQLKSLGLIDKLITGPIWRLCESDMHILDLSGQFRELIAWLGANISDPSDFLHGIPPRFSDSANRQGSDECFAALIADSDIGMDDHLPLIVQHVLQSAKRYFELSISEFINSGKYSEGVASDTLRKETVSVLKSNRLPESVFGLTDWLFTHAPNMTMLTRETLVM
uniref:Uncharacterized protein n=1 Tax=Plectus sambesii TaxID=2011161 RepID=A0A914UN06_9BILA